MAQRPIGTEMDAHGVTLDLEDDDLIEGVLVIAKVNRGEDGKRTVIIGGSQHLDWYDQFALAKLGAYFTTHDDD